MGTPMKEINILLTKYSDCVSSLVYYVCGRSYTHASISLEEEPGKYYSFNYRGFAVETLEKHRKRGVKHSCCYRIQITEAAYKNIQDILRFFLAEKDSYRYTRLGVLCCVLHIPMHWERHYFCSQFVAELLERSGAVTMRKTSSLFLPGDFIELIEGHLPYQRVDNLV